MNTNHKTREQLLIELEKSNTKIIELDKSEAKCKKAKEAIQKSEEKYRMLTDNSIDVIWQMNLELVFTYVSPSVKNFMGYTVDEWVGSRLSQYATRKEFFNMVKKALYAIKHYKEFKQLTFDVVMMRKDGTEIPVEITGRLLLNKKGLPFGLQGTTRDISERKKAEKTLVDKENELRLITNSNLDTVFMLNKTGTIVYLNQAAEKLYNRKLKDMLGTSFTKYVPAKELPRYFKKLKQVFLHKKVTNFETYIVNRDGQQLPVEINGQIINRDGKYFALGTIRDITERMQAEEKLKKYYEHLEDLVKERTAELEKKNKDLETKNAELSHYNELFIGREFRIKELKDQIKKTKENTKNS